MSAVKCRLQKRQRNNFRSQTLAWQLCDKTLPPVDPQQSEQTVNQIGVARVRSQTTSARIGSSQRGVSRSTVKSPPGKTELRILPISVTAGPSRRAKDEQGVLSVRNAIIHSKKLYIWYVPYKYGEVFIGTYLYKTECALLV